jgi:peptide/nickel transport system substrate-binding protein
MSTDDVQQAAAGLTRRTVVGAGAAVALGGGLLSACGGSDNASKGGAVKPENSPADTREVGRGGNFRVGVGTGGSSDTLDPHAAVTLADAARNSQLFERLVRPTADGLDYLLAEEIAPNADATEWTIRLKEGIEWHNGKTLAADDVMAMIQRLQDPKLPASSLVAWADAKRMKKMDERTVRLTLDRPFGDVPNAFADNNIPLTPAGFDTNTYVGTGPFKFKSFQPGKQSVFERYENYHGEAARLDTITIVNLDDAARVNALVSGDVNVMAPLQPTAYRQLAGDPNVKVAQVESDTFYPILMNVEKPPFDDVRVRQAMRLLANREEMVAQALLGLGTVGNDLYSRQDPLYRKFPQREQDVEKAKSLLKAAGRLDDTFELIAAPAGPGAVEACDVFAQQCKAAGVRVKVRRVDSGTWVDRLGEWPFINSQWPQKPYRVMCSLSDAPKAAFNETHFGDNAPKFASLYGRLNKSPDKEDQKRIAAEMQQIQFDEGAFLIWGFVNVLSPYRSNVAGLKFKTGTGYEFDGFDFSKAGFVA